MQERAAAPASGSGDTRQRYREVHYEWTWDLEATPEQLWPLIADTNRFDRDTGVPRVELAGGGRELANGRIEASTRQYGVRLDYVQEPFEWEEPRWLRVRRTFSTGPLATLAVELRLDERDGGGTSVDYQVWARPRNVLGLSIPIQIGVVFARRFRKVAARFDELAVADAHTRPSGRTSRVRRAGRDRLTTRAGELVEAGSDPTLVERLVDVVAGADDVVAARMRPYELADAWGVDRGAVLDVFLRATRAGIVGFRWDVLCPLCRVAKASTPTLRDLPGTVHCDTCRVDSTANFARSVELTFRPSPAVRVVDDDEYCIGNPTATPHVVAQALVGAGERAVLRPELEPGRYRLRALGVPGGCYVRVARGGAGDGEAAMGAGGWPDVELEVGERPALAVVGDPTAERLVLFERTAWGDAAVTAAEVTARQEFRDLFADEALRPGEHVSVGSMAIVFTDLVGSTRLYRDIGDAVAFGRVLDHFEILRECIGEEGGAVVKTIGDAVMAVFPTPAPALRALRRAQARLATGSDDALRLKGGIHYGPCLAVTMNGHLDYFGTTVNFAARLEGQSGGEAIVISDAVHDDPEVAAILATSPEIVAVALTPELKGFEGGARVWRLSTL